MNAETSLTDAVTAIFSSEGPLARIPGFEKRPQQEEMARAIATALEEEKHLIVEAGTGVGKSLAYLIPALLASQQEGRKAIISTHTITLQEQLLYKDIPLLEKILGISKNGTSSMPRMSLQHTRGTFLMLIMWSLMRLEILPALILLSSAMSTTGAKRRGVLAARRWILMF